jgi:hypothetical protein
MYHGILSSVYAFPTTFFVDATGTVVGKAIFGALPDRYIPTVEALLNGEAAPAEGEADGEAAPTEEPAAAQTAEKAAVYRVIVADADGNPVEGVAVQFCDDTTCQVQMTNENGVATFRPEKPNDYDVHILKVPDGYAEDTQSYKTEGTWSELTITLQKAE